MLIASCATAPPAATTRPQPVSHARVGAIVSVDKVEEHGGGGGEAFVGLMVGGMLFGFVLFPHDLGRTLVGVDDGSSGIAAPDGTPSRLPRYQVVVRFDDGGSMTLVYTNDVPFHEGERVALTQQGLVGSAPMSRDELATRDARVR